MDSYGKYKYIEVKQWAVVVQSTVRSRVQYGTRSYQMRVNCYEVVDVDVDVDGGGGFQILSFKFRAGTIMIR
jgi:hypothetical protein